MLERWTVQALTTVSLVVGRAFGPPDPTGTGRRRDRGDVPGWVMITVMTAIVVIALLAVFQEQVTKAVTNAFTSVNDSGKD